MATVAYPAKDETTVSPWLMMSVSILFQHHGMLRYFMKLNTNEWVLQTEEVQHHAKH